MSNWKLRTHVLWGVLSLVRVGVTEQQLKKEMLEEMFVSLYIYKLLCKGLLFVCALVVICDNTWGMIPGIQVYSYGHQRRAIPEIQNVVGFTRRLHG